MKENAVSVVAALEIEDHQLRMLVGQFNNGLLYIVAKETISSSGFDGSTITDEKALVESIKKLTSSISQQLSTPLTSVVLAIPAYRFKREKKQYDLLLKDKIVTQKDINAIYKQSYETRINNDLELINSLCAHYRINGITYPKAPLQEKSELLSCEVDLLCADKNLTYDLVRVCEKANLKVLDIYLDNYASCYEAAIFEQSFGNYMININLEGNRTVYSLLYNGRFISGFSDNHGYNQLIKPLMNKFSLSYKDSSRLLFRYGIVGIKSAVDRVINRWNDKDEVKTITYNDIQQCIYQPANQMIEDFYSYCSKIVGKGNVAVVITGQGANLQNLQESVAARFECDVKCYFPDIIGAREAGWTVDLGMINLFEEDCKRKGVSSDCVDSLTYCKNMSEVFEKQDNNLTSKFKTFTDKIFEEN